MKCPSSWGIDGEPINQFQKNLAWQWPPAREITVVSTEPQSPLCILSIIAVRLIFSLRA